MEQFPSGSFHVHRLRLGTGRHRGEPSSWRGVPQRTMHTTLSSVLLLLLPCFVQAQDTLPDHMADHRFFGPRHFANATDSVEFTQFRSGLKMVDTTASKDTTTFHYRMVWSEGQHGGHWTVSRGDGSVIRTTLDIPPPFGDGMNLHFLTADGRRGMLIVHDIPCGMICRSARYYVEE